MGNSVRRTVPFVSPSGNRDSLFTVDGNVVTVPAGKLSVFASALRKTLDLTRVGSSIPAAAAEELVADQYAACLDHVFASSTWATFRDGTGREALLAYLIETRHYLHAASARMSAGVAASPPSPDFSDHLAEHLVEEADHAKFFEAALDLLGYSQALVSRLRPTPETRGWIFLMRRHGLDDPLSAALCSGLMESSAKPRSLVLQWHETLVKKGLMPRHVMEAMRAHVDLDSELGHGDNWIDCIRCMGNVPVTQLVRALNAVTITAEALRRWSDSLGSSAIGGIGPMLSQARVEPRTPVQDPIFDGGPVWSAPFLEALCHAAAGSAGVRTVLSAAYALPSDAVLTSAEGLEIMKHARAIRGRCSVPAVKPRRSKDIANVLEGWLSSVDGHRVWQSLLEASDPTVALGWIVENRYYLASSRHHVGSAVFACDDPLIRSMFVHHLDEERRHEDILSDALTDVMPALASVSLRPLSTTVAFVGYLRELALTDWKAYLMALCFLQKSLRPGDRRHQSFYAKMSRQSHAAAVLARAMRRHDRLDASLGHERDAEDLLGALTARHDVPMSSFCRAAVVPELAWLFLDGIVDHYAIGSSAIHQRIGWAAAS